MNVPESARSEASLAGDRADRREFLVTLFHAEYPRLRGLAYVLLGDTHAAEEVAMEAFVKAFSSWPRMRHLRWPRPYLRRIAINLCRERMRRHRIELRANELIEHARKTQPPGWENDRSDARLDLWDAVRQLPERQRTCVVLRYLEDLSDAEIARTLGCTVGTVKTHIFRARASLEARLLDLEDDQR